ncbi:MAG: hypothetical protein LKKZDAJK_000675, partial [Candidatus Fervidibacter sp.]
MSKEEQTDAPLVFAENVGAVISRDNDNGDAKMAMSAATNGGYSRR